MSKEDLDMDIFGSDDFELNIDSEVTPELTEVLEEAEAAALEQEKNTEEDDDTPPAEVKQFLNDDEPSEEEESQEDVVKKETGDNDEGKDTDDSDSPNIYSSFANVLNEQGVLPSLDPKAKIETIDDLVGAINAEKEIQAKNYLISKLGEDGYDAIEKGISLAEYQQYKQGVDTLDSISEESLAENLELSKKVILQDYIEQGIPEDRAYKFLERIIDSGDEAVLEEAKTSLSSLKEIQEIKLEKAKEARQAELQAQRQQQEKIDNDLKNSIYGSDEIIEGLTMTKAMKEKVYKSITGIVGQSPDGVAENRLMRHRRENPIEFDKKLYYLYELTNQFQDFSALVKKSKSKVTSDFETLLRTSQSQINNDQPGFVNDPNSYGGIGDELVID